MSQEIEFILYELSNWFLIPVLGLIIASFVYALYMLGGFLVEAFQRLTGFLPHRPLWRMFRYDCTIDLPDLELAIMKEMEGLRLTSRAAPLLGLVATMIPMGPALAGVAVGDMVSVGEQVGIAFAAVIIALMAASATFFVHTVRRRWRLSELREIERHVELLAARKQSMDSPATSAQKEVERTFASSFRAEPVTQQS